MVSKGMCMLRVVLGAYLAFIGVRVIIQVINTNPSNALVMGLLGIVFVVVGVGYAIYYIRRLWRTINADPLDTEVFDADADEESEEDEAEESDEEESSAAAEDAGEETPGRPSVTLVDMKQNAPEDDDRDDAPEDADREDNSRV